MNKPPEPTHLRDMSDEKKCEWYRYMDEKYHTAFDSPLHHDNRCLIHKREEWE